MRKSRTCNEADDETDDDDSGGSDGRVPQVGDCVQQVDARSVTTRHTHRGSVTNVITIKSVIIIIIINIIILIIITIMIIIIMRKFSNFKYDL